MTSKFKTQNKYRHFRQIDKISRFRGISKTRHNKFRFDANERISDFSNNFIREIKAKINSNYLTAYPETEILYDILAKKFKLNREMFVLTAGSDLAIKTCFELLIKPSDKIITIYPTYGMIDVYAKLYQAKQTKITYNNKLELDYKKLIEEINNKTKLIIIANPNNHTGTIFSNKQIIALLKKAKKNNSYVLIDEAYYGFHNYTALYLLKKFSNLIITRTFSKAYGLAGCRVGLLIANKVLARRLYKFRPMYEISSLSVLIVKQIIKKEQIFKNYIKNTAKGKRFLINNLNKLGFKYFNSYSNFIVIHFKTANLKKKMFKYLNRKKILSRDGPNIPAFKNCIRFTLGPVKYMKIIADVLKEFKKKNK